MDILPSDHAEFSSKAYWEKFFQLRGQESFEWYGSFEEIYPHIQQRVPTSSDVLMIGCGNSNFSSELYDKGVESIVNLDFSDLVIQEMKIKNMYRSNMRWDVGDMTDMHMYDTASFDVVLDKGALDALISTPTPDLLAKGRRMFEEIGRVLRINGKYICISLAEDFVLQTLTSFFLTSSRVSDSDWMLDIERIPSSKPTPFIPFLFTITKKAISSSSRLPQPQLFVDSLGNRLITGTSIDGSLVAASIKQMQDFQELRFKMHKLDVGRFETVQLWAPQHREIPRFTVYILDVSQESSLACAVFFVPTGRESDYQFTTKEGLIDIAFQANCRRFIAVSCNRPHEFPAMSALQAELSPFMIALAPGDRDAAQQIPFMAVGSDPEWETIAQGRSAISGAYLVEEKEDEDDSRGAIFRRLVFLQNQQLVQSEARLLSTTSTTTKKPNGKKDNKKKSQKKVAASGAEYRLDPWNVDDLYRSMMACLCLSPSGQLPRRALIIGLGGGSLVMALQRFVPGIVIDAVELDGEVVSLAQQHFAFQAGPQTTVHVADGLQFVTDRLSAATGISSFDPYDLIVVDVDSKDTSLGLSAPPRAFLVPHALQSMWSLVAPQGLLLFNVVARSKDRLAEFYDRLHSELVGSSGACKCFRVKPSDETVNLVVACVRPAVATSGVAKSSSSSTHTESGKKGAAAANALATQRRAGWYSALRNWIQVGDLHFA